VGWETKRELHGDLLKLLREILREPTFPEAELEILKRNQKQGIEKAMVDPQGLAFNTLTRTLNPHPKDSIHYVPTYEESLARLAKVQCTDVVKLYNEQIGAANGELVIVGDFDPDATVKQLETIFRDWKSPVSYQRIPAVLVDVKGSKQTINTPDKENAVYGAAMRFALNDTAPDYPALEIGNYVLGVSFTSRLVDRLRQKEGWSYGTGSQLSVGSKDKISEFLIYAFCNPEVIDNVDKGALEELNKVLKTGITADELKLATTSYLEEQQVERGRDAGLAAQLRAGLYLGRTMAYQAELEKKIAALTVQAVNRAMAAHLSSGRLVIVRAGDFNKKKQ
jgi:zinc protease